MTFTSHGHHIDGSPLSSEDRPQIARCGGPGICGQCSREAGLYRGKPFNPNTETFEEKARRIVYDYALAHLDRSDKAKGVDFRVEDVYVVIATYVLGNWKCLVSTTLLDGMYYEVTYNLAKCETYLDAYKKFDNRSFAD